MPELVTIFILSYDPFGENSMYYEAGTVMKTHPAVTYNDGVRRIFLYADGEPVKEDNEDEQTLKNLLRYINKSTSDNVLDDNTRKLDDIVNSTKARKEIGIKYMKSWERERQLREDGKMELLDELVSDGTITEERAEEIRARLIPKVYAQQKEDNT